MDFPRLVFNFHAYCPDRNPVTGNSPNPAACADHVLAAVGRRESQRVALALAGHSLAPRSS